MTRLFPFAVRGRKNNKPKQMSDLASVKVVLVFNDNSGFVVPLSSIQGAFLVRSLGFTIDSNTGELSHYTDRKSVV